MFCCKRYEMKKCQVWNEMTKYGKAILYQFTWYWKKPSSLRPLPRSVSVCCSSEWLPMWLIMILPPACTSVPFDGLWYFVSWQCYKYYSSCNSSSCIVDNILVLLPVGLGVSSTTVGSFYYWLWMSSFVWMMAKNRTNPPWIRHWSDIRVVSAPLVPR